MELLSDSKHLKIALNDFGRQLLFEHICQRYGYVKGKSYYFVIRDKRNGVYLFHLPIVPYANYTTSLIFQGYSNDSQLLRDIFRLIPLRRWKARRIDIALDTDLPYNQLHAVHPSKRAGIKHYRTSVYLGSHSSQVQLHMYDKKEQMYHQWGKITDTWTRIELRFRFEPMKRISALSIDDFVSAKDYNIITDISMMPDKLNKTVTELNKGQSHWSDITRTTQRKIREYGHEHGVNMHDLILSKLTDIDFASFLYPSTEQYLKLTS